MTTEQAVKRLKAVVALHHQMTLTNPVELVCHECGKPFPCPTAVAANPDLLGVRS